MLLGGFDGDLLFLRQCERGDRNRNGEDPLVIGGGDIVFVRARGQGHRTHERRSGLHPRRLAALDRLRAYLDDEGFDGGAGKYLGAGQ